jgi:hypothetical protein
MDLNWDEANISWGFLEDGNSFIPICFECSSNTPEIEHNVEHNTLKVRW